MGFTETLTIIFVVMKLLGVIGWSWWLVLLPEIIAAVFYTVLIVAAFIVSAQSEREINRTIKRWRD